MFDGVAEKGGEETTGNSGEGGRCVGKAGRIFEWRRERGEARHNRRQDVNLSRKQCLASLGICLYDPYTLRMKISNKNIWRCSGYGHH